MHIDWTPVLQALVIALPSILGASANFIAIMAMIWSRRAARNTDGILKFVSEAKLNEGMWKGAQIAKEDARADRRELVKAMKTPKDEP